MKLSRSVKNLTDTKKHAAQNAHRYTVSLPLSKSFSIFLKTSQSKQKGQRKWKNIIMLGSAHLALLSLNGRENILVGISICLYYLYCCEVFFSMTASPLKITRGTLFHHGNRHASIVSSALFLSGDYV